MYGTVELSDGRSRSLASLINDVPSTAFLGETHVQVCELLAKDVREEREFKVFVNTISRKSAKARAISALIALIDKGNLPVVRVVSDFIDDRFAVLLGDQVELCHEQGGDQNAMGRIEILRFLGKAIIHRSFRLGGLVTARLKTDTVVRAWVDTTDSIYPNLVDVHPLIVFPFSGPASRQFKYLLTCVRKKRTFAISGIPYRFRDLIRVAVDWKHRDRLITRAEVNGFERMADQFLVNGVKRIYTTDEFEPASFVMHDRLRQNGVTSHNRSHGVATYGSYVCYSTFRCHSHCQLDFYKRRGDVEEFTVKSFVSPAVAQVNSPDFAYRPVFIYLMGNWRKAGKKYEAEAELQAIEKVVQLGNEIGISTVLKAHPNESQTETRNLEDRFGVQVVHDLPDTSKQHPVFLTLLSSTYFDYFGKGPIRVCSNKMLNPELLFGEKIETFDFNDNDRSLTKFTEKDYWFESFQAQLKSATVEPDGSTIVSF